MVPSPATVPKWRWSSVTTATFDALTVSGVGPSLVFERALNGPVVAQWVREQLAPTLRPGQIVILDNLSVHKHPGARQAIEIAGFQLRFLPAYSPDFNPIELVFGRLEPHLRAIAARTVDLLMTAIGDGLDAITAVDARMAFAMRALDSLDNRYGTRSRARSRLRRDGDRPIAGVSPHDLAPPRFAA